MADAADNTLYVTAANLVLAGDKHSSLAVLKVLDQEGQHHRFVMAGFQIHQYLRQSAPLSRELWADLPQLPFDEPDWDADTAHQMTSLSFDEYEEGLVLRGVTQRGERVCLALHAPCRSLFRHYVEQVAPSLLDMDSPGLGNA